MSQYYDWNPLFEAINGQVDKWGQRNQWNSALNSMFGQGTPAPQNVALPKQSVPLPSMQTQGGAQIGGGSMDIGQQSINAAMPSVNGHYAPGTPMNYSGPLAQSLGQDAANVMMPLLKNLPMPYSMPLLLASAKSSIDNMPRRAALQAFTNASASNDTAAMRRAAVNLWGQGGDATGLATALKVGQPEYKEVGAGSSLAEIGPDGQPTGKMIRGAPKAPTTRTIQQGNQVINQQFNPMTGQWEQVGAGPRFRPQTTPQLVGPRSGPF